ncbi:uncharacterized protein BDR25DRAFT_306837 [Lindgomyces ingoldianus]|uniref:Uncharacterized protein n=1 Tax=Lindgomyces ingoldianus TaxID=673940 RepID=A0ACB6QE19_9PLEO|nr:uncharacterized protein BDR25DRAFT_306837 [Lindgomyces ingoldianus]KAF2465198.1 hypothetical protein BDR25DRAFT_306837 [Lindgomyces ingoldianus]
MGSCVAASALLKAWLSWLRSGFLWRLLGLPAALLALHLEIYGSSPAATSLILHRLSRRLRFPAFCVVNKKKGHDMNTIFFVGGSDVMDTPQSLLPSMLNPRSKGVARKRSMTLNDKDHMLPLPPSGGSPNNLGPPSKHLPGPLPSSSNSPSSTSTLSHSSPTPLMPSHARSMSHADVVKQGKRLSLHFPIQPAAGSPSPAFSPRSRPQSWVSTPIISTPVFSPGVIPSPTEGNFLAVLAAQERRVLELKEELAKAESDLKSLKSHWASHESVKQRNELKNVTQLQPLNTTITKYPLDKDDDDGSTLWLQKEMERRKSLLSGTKTSSRKVFSGSRHMRTLSLLSPEQNFSPSFPQPLDIDDPKDEANKRPQTLARNSISPGNANHITDTINDDRYDLGGLSAIQRDALLRTGKQMATDFKDGLLTFIEDIRQATVGDEAIIGVDGSGSLGVRSPSIKNNRKTSEARPALNRASSLQNTPATNTDDIADDFWKANGLSEPKATPPNKKTHAKSTRTPQKPMPEVAKDFESWDSWDTPNEKYAAQPEPSSSSSDESDAPSSSVSGNSGRSSARTSTSSVGTFDETSMGDPKRKSIPWPDLVKLSPTNLKRTASHLMKEWEKNLTPPPSSRDSGHVSGDYIGRSGSPAGLP